MIRFVFILFVLFFQSIYTQDFSNTQLNTVNRDSADLFNPENWAARGGYWYFDGKTIFGQGYIGHNKFWYDQESFSDFIFEVRLNKTSESGPFGLIFRYNKKKDIGYRFLFWPFGGYRLDIIGSENDPVRSLRTRKTPFRYQGTNVWNKAKIIAHGSKFEFYLNDHLIDSISDDAIPTGKVGLYLHADPRQQAQFQILQLGPLEKSTGKISP